MPRHTPQSEAEAQSEAAMASAVGSDADIQDCVNGVCARIKASNGSTRRKILDVVGIIAPLLIRSPDPRLKALGLALAAVAAASKFKR